MGEGARLINPSCNPLTVIDGRGGIFTYIPDEPVVELNMVNVKAGHLRGEHYHKEFVEYFLVISGRGLYETHDDDGNKKQFFVTGGECLRIPPGVPHVLHAIDDIVAVAALTKKWDLCDEPITSAVL